MRFKRINNQLLSLGILVSLACSMPAWAQDSLVAILGKQNISSQLFAEQASLGVEAFKEKARRIGMDDKSFHNCLDSGQALANFDQAIALRPSFVEAHYNRGIALSQLVRHLPAGLQYVSLQAEVRESDRETLAQRPGIVDFAEELRDFGDTAALCECLDLVISVDTSVAHLSGALGKDGQSLVPVGEAASSTEDRRLERRPRTPHGRFTATIRPRLSRSGP